MLKAANMWAVPAEWGVLAQLPVTFCRLRQMGFEGVELNFDPKGPIGFSTTREELQAVRTAADAAGISLATLATGAFWANNFGMDVPEQRAEARRIAVRMLEIGQALGVSTLLVVPAAVDVVFIPQAPVISYETVMERVREAIVDLIPECERTGVRIGIENVWNKFFLSPLEFRDFIDAMDSPYIGSYFDIGNIIATGYPEQWISILGKRIFAVHVKDFKRSVGNMDGFVDLLEGDVNWPAVMNALTAIGYQGAVTVETFPYRHYPLARAEQASNAMDWIMGQKSDAIYSTTKE